MKQFKRFKFLYFALLILLSLFFLRILLTVWIDWYTSWYFVFGIVLKLLFTAILLNQIKSKNIEVLMPKKYKTLIYVICLLLILYLNIDITSNTLIIILFLVSCISTGILEEFLFRVFVFSYMNQPSSKLIRSSLHCSFYFAIFHFTNLYFLDYKIQIFTQIVFAFGMGFLFQALYIYFKDVFLVITIHAIVNFYGGLTIIQKMGESSPVLEQQFNYLSFFVSIAILIVLNLIIVFPIGLFLLSKVQAQRKIMGSNQ